jgi:hypothetical protein
MSFIYVLYDKPIYYIQFRFRLIITPVLYRKVRGSNLGPETCYLTEIFSCFPQSIQPNAGKRLSIPYTGMGLQVNAANLMVHRTRCSNGGFQWLYCPALLH